MKIYTIALFCIGLILNSTNSYSQNDLKIGHINVVEIITALPETDSAQTLLEKDTKELESMNEEMQVEYNKLVNDYQENLNTYSDMVRSTKESAIFEMQNKIQSFQENASQQLQERNAELMQPIYKRVQLAVEKIAADENFTYVLDLSKGAVVFTGVNSQDLSPLVLEELGLAGNE